MKYLLPLLFILALVGCGRQVEVPPAHVGKIMTKDGYQANLVPTSKLRLDPCISYCDRMVLLDVSDSAFNESLDIFIPKDKLNLKVAIQVTLSINPKKTVEIFNSISPAPTDDEFLSLISKKDIYATYAKQVVLTETREYLSNFSIAEISSSLEAVNAELRVRLSKALGDRTPFSVRYVGLTDVKYPEIITAAQEGAAKRREQVQQEEAQLEISKVSLERQLQETRLQRLIQKEKAETEAESQRIQAATVDPRVLELRKIENQAAWIAQWDGKLPTTIMGDAVPMLNIGK